MHSVGHFVYLIQPKLAAQGRKTTSHLYLQFWFSPGST